MRHHGVPTRFLDFSYSFYVALYFASQNVDFHDSDSTRFSVFAINRVRLENKYKNACLPEEIRAMYLDETAGDSFGKSLAIQKAIIDKRFGRFRAIINMSPLNRNTRLVNQRGLFLMSADSNSTFMENLIPLLADEEIKNTRVLKINVTLNKADVIYLFTQLQNMSIGSRTLSEKNLDSLGDIIKRKLIESRYSDVLSLNDQGNVRSPF